MSIRVGRRIYDRSGRYTDPEYPEFTPIICMTASTEYGCLGPYCLRDEKGRLLECVYQFQKCFAKVPASTQYASRYDRRVIWNWPAETHYENGKVLPAY